MTAPRGLAATLHDAVALAEVFGPGARIGIGAAERDADIIAPTGASLTGDEAGAAVRRGGAGVFLAFGEAAQPAPDVAAPLIELLCHLSGAGFMAACLAAPWAGRRVFQGHLFEHATLRGNLIQQYSMALDGAVGLVAREVVVAGAGALRKAVTRLKEQGRTLVLIDAVEEADCAIVTAALAGQPLCGGGAWLAARPHAAEAAAAPAEGPLAILSGALDRETVLQVGTARAEVPVFDLDFAAEDPADAALRWAARQTGERFLISSSMPPDRMMPGAPAAAILGRIAAGLADAGVRRFLLTGGETAAAVLAASRVTGLTVGAAFGPLRWLHGASATYCIKPRGVGGKNLFLPEFEPQIRLNEPAR